MLLGGSGNDILVGGPGEDELYGESGDTLYGDTDDIMLSGGSGRNQTFVSEVEPAGPMFTYSVGPVEDDGTCTVSFVLEDGAPLAQIVVLFTFDNNPEGGPGVFTTTNASGFAEGVLGAGFLASGSVVTDARVSLNTFPQFTLIATAPAGQTCGGSGT